MQSETHNPTHFLENFYKADFGKGGTLKFTCKGGVGRSNTLPNRSNRENHQGGSPATALLEPETRLMTVLELCSLDAGAGVALVTAEALHAAPLIRITHTAAAPVQVPREIVCAFHIHINFFCRAHVRDAHVSEVNLQKIQVEHQTTPSQPFFGPCYLIGSGGLFLAVVLLYFPKS